MSDSPNFLTYAQTAFDPFEERPFCAVDSLVFAWLSYLRLPGDMAELTNWQGLDVRELLRAECYRDMIDDLWDPEGSRALLEAVAASPRYRGVHVCGYRAVSDVVATEQFAAMAFRFPAGFSYLSFRGTRVSPGMLVPDHLLSHSNSFGFEMEKDAAGCRALIDS